MDAHAWRCVPQVLIRNSVQPYLSSVRSYTSLVVEGHVFHACCSDLEVFATVLDGVEVYRLSDGMQVRRWGRSDLVALSWYPSCITVACTGPDTTDVIVTEKTGDEIFEFDRWGRLQSVWRCKYSRISSLAVVHARDPEQAALVLVVEKNTQAVVWVRRKDHAYLQEFSLVTSTALLCVNPSERVFVVDGWKMHMFELSWDTNCPNVVPFEYLQRSTNFLESAWWRRPHELVVLDETEGTITTVRASDGALVARKAFSRVLCLTQTPEGQIVVLRGPVPTVRRKKTHCH